MERSPVATDQSPNQWTQLTLTRRAYALTNGLLKSMVAKVDGVLDISRDELVKQFTELALATIERAGVQRRD